MGVTRRYVFPIIRIVLWAVIAASLAVLAFRGATAESSDPLVPTARIVEPEVEVTAGSITNTVTVQATVAADPAVPVRATQAGTVSRVLATPGAAVAAGAPLVEITTETPVDPTVTTDPATGEQTVRENRPKVTRTTVTAPVAGTPVLTVLKDQLVSVGDTLGSVSPGTLSVTGTLTAEQQYRLLDVPPEAQVTLKGGPAPFACTGLRIGAATAAAPAPQPETGMPVEAPEVPTGTVSCAIPPDVVAFAGLGADLSITNGVAEDVPVVPVTSVQGSVQNGNVWVVTADGGREERAVTLGLTDGEQVQITSGLEVGERVLQLAPVGDVTAPGTCADGSQAC